MTDEIKPGYYWAKINYRFLKEYKIEIIEYRKMSEWEGTSEYEWFSCGWDVPLDFSDIMLLPHNGPLAPPQEE